MLQKILIVSFLFSLINCTCTSYYRDNSTENYDYELNNIFSVNYKDSSASTKECKKRSFNQLEQEKNAYKCCYWKEKCTFKDDDDDHHDLTTEFEGCYYLDKKSYDNIKDAIKEGKKYCSKIDIDCSGTSLSYAYLMLIMLFLL